MTDLITGAIKGDREAGLLFDKFPEIARASLERRMKELVGELKEAVDAAVPRRTGKLASEIAAFTDSDQDGVVGKVKVLTGGNVGEIKRALSLEYGASGTFSVRSYTRLSIGAAYSAKGGVVQAYSRSADIDALSYMRGPLAGIADRANDALRSALEEAAAQ